MGGGKVARRDGQKHRRKKENIVGEDHTLRGKRPEFESSANLTGVANPCSI